MPTWHQERPGKPLPKLTHPTLWRSYNPSGHLSVMTFDSQKDCLEYCKRTGDVALPPDNYQAPLKLASHESAPLENQDIEDGAEDSEVSPRG